ncbi:MAG: GFA family protein [Methylobacterium mesophilicum]|nr:GFA family protein [Methylobacterium mesophilicum]
MTDKPLPWKGGCRCSRVRFEVTAAPVLTSACHCQGCQRMTSSADSLSMTLPASGFRVTEGEPVIGGLYGATRHFFCSWCMSWMWTRPDGLDWIVNLRPTMLDEPRDFSPFLEVWTEQGFKWAKTPARHSFGQAPPLKAYQELMEEFASSNR